MVYNNFIQLSLQHTSESSLSQTLLCVPFFYSSEFKSARRISTALLLAPTGPKKLLIILSLELRSYILYFAILDFGCLENPRLLDLFYPIATDSETIRKFLHEKRLKNRLKSDRK